MSVFLSPAERCASVSVSALSVMPANHSSLPLDQHLSPGRQTRRVSPLSRRAIAFRPRPDRHSADSPPSSVIVAERSADFDGDSAIERAVSSMGDVERLSESEQFTKLRHFLEAVYQSASADTEDAARKAIIGLVVSEIEVLKARCWHSCFYRETPAGVA
jgi:hypothetical protein